MDQVFEEGDIVEVESIERGFEGSRAKATLLAALPGGHWRVRYVDFKDAVGRHPLLGEVREKYLRPPPPKPLPGATEWVPGVGAPPRHPQPTRTNLLARRLMKRAKACIWAMAVARLHPDSVPPCRAPAQETWWSTSMTTVGGVARFYVGTMILILKQEALNLR